MDVEALERILATRAAEGTPVSVIYTIASYQSPTGTVLPLDRRLRLIELAHQHDAVIVEDAAYHPLWYDAPPPSSLLGLDTHGVVVLSATFSKLLAPGLRLGWLAGPRHLIERVAAARRDFSVSRPTALAVARYCNEGLLDPHIEVLRAAYKIKRDAAVEGLRTHCDPWVTYNTPTGGFYIWLQLTPAIDAEELRQEAARRGLGLRTGAMFGGTAYRTAAVRLSVAQVPLEKIAPGIEVLGEALSEVAGRPH
jgi:2-aminoadipate transaminase